MSTCCNNPEKVSTTKINKHTTCGYSLLTKYSFDAVKDKLDCYRSKDYKKKFCQDLKKHVEKIVNYEKNDVRKKAKKKKIHHKQRVCYICKKYLVLMVIIKINMKLEIIIIMRREIIDLMSL